MSAEGPAPGPGQPGQPDTPESETAPETVAPPSDAPAPPPSEQVWLCDLCGSVMLNLHCKLICERCGYKRDCSDP